MADTDFDWTFDDAPADESVRPDPPPRPPKTAPRHAPAPPPAPASRTRPVPRPAVRRRWRLAALALAPLAVAGLVIYLVYAFGWQRVRAQLAREIVYEDEQSLAGNVNAVMALHAWGNTAWQRRRTAEVEAGLAAPVPAASLTPLAEPPQIVAVDTFGERLFSSTVVRQYTDSAGGVYRFRLTQRYFNNGPGLWQRLPPDEARLAATTFWSGRRISVTYPVADAEWMAAALPQIDAYLVQACADWACPSELALPVLFTGQLDEMPRPVETNRTAAIAGGYPLIFDTPFRAPRYPPLIVLPSPQLAGVPHDEAASQALVRALTADFLGELAGDAGGTTRAQHFYFLDALVARAEARLGLSAAPPQQPALTEYLALDDLWGDTTGSTGGARRPVVAPRLQAMWFLNAVLDDRLPSADAALLRAVRDARSLGDWLSAAQVDGPAAMAAWEAEVTSVLAAAAPANWGQLRGLAYTCAGEAWLVEAAGPRPLPRAAGEYWLGPVSVSPEGLHAAVPAVISDTGQLRLVNLETLTTTVVVAHDAYPLGWAATGELVYVEQLPSTVDGRPVSRLRIYRVESGVFGQVTGMEVAVPRDQPAWSANRQALAFTLTDNALAVDARTLPAILAFDGTQQLTLAAWEGHAPTLSPDGRWLAYITNQVAGTLSTSAEARVELLDLETKAASVALGPADLPTERPVDLLTDLSWSPDGQRLALVARQGSDDHLYVLHLGETLSGPLKSITELAVPAASFQLAGFSFDGELLAVAESAATGPRLLVLAVNAPGAPIFEATASLAAWSPNDHLLAIANAAGLYVADPASSEVHWVAGGECRPSWRSAN